MTAHFTWLDWLVVVAYAFGMLAIGWYYSRKNETAADYLLGGRNINPISLGLSLFATLMSTITYLALPGEIIKNGPMILGMLASYPLVGIVVGWLMIPFFVRLNATSANEILEARLGLSVRILGTLIFLVLRLLWMAVIIFATIDKVLVPLLGLPTAATPYLCMVMAVITVIYTSMGGLKAVVLTDVIQSSVLFAGALVTLGLITWRMGGVEWWPHQWPTHWPEPEFGWDLTARSTFLGSLIGYFTWHVCTAGSDQMAIQRYLASPNVSSARSVLVYSLVANTIVQFLLAVVGLALLGYFTMNPALLAAGQSVVKDADKLFPRFIVVGLPMGASGLIVAGLLAAAMSSLSSGLNSCCTVVNTDLINRFRTVKDTDAAQVARVKYISALVGLVVVGLTFAVCQVQGNLLDVAFKVVNLFTAPLFGIFFMAMFVPWATAPGTFLGAAVGITVVTSINFWEEMTGSPGLCMFWAMPLGLLAQIAAGSLVSLLPWGRRASEAKDLFQKL